MHLCGLIGLLGESTDPGVSFGLITRVFAESESRGTDAAGFWGSNKVGSVVYHKEPTKASELVKTPVWNKVRSFNPDLLLIHARQTTPGVGESRVNRNNHPFVSQSRSLGLIHNGRIPEFGKLRRKYHVQSDCDSEVLLRIIEAASHTKPEDLAARFPDLCRALACRFAGIADIFSVTNGHLAVAVGEISPQGQRSLWLFRNCHRSLWLVDLREALGQVFFCSTPEIWQDAVQDDRRLLGRQKLVELPPEEVWHLEINASDRKVNGVRRFRVERDESAPGDDGAVFPVPQQEVGVPLVTSMNEYTPPPLDHGLSAAQIDAGVAALGSAVTSLGVMASNLIREGSLSHDRYVDLLENVLLTKGDVEEMLRSLDS